MWRQSTIIVIALLISVVCSGQAPFEIKDGRFLKNGEEVFIIGGEMHYARIPHEYWRHRIRMAKAMGINTISTYAFWNLHEPTPGEWDFSGDKDIAEFIGIAGEEGLMVLLRPGPYVCAEWDYGGLPWWLQTVPDIKIRQDNQPYLDRVRIWLEKLYSQVKDLLATHGGPVVMVQCENEFGSFFLQCPEIPEDSHHRYMSRLSDMMKEIGYDVPFYTADGAKKIHGGKTEGALTCVDGERIPEKVKEAIDEHCPGGPYFISEFYPGWLSHWGEEFATRDAEMINSYVSRYLKEGIHFNYYMIHGGTNFGFNSGANYTSRRALLPDITSYDYDAPITEAGWATDKFHLLRNTIAEHFGRALPEIPDQIPVMEIPEIRMKVSADVLAYLKEVKPLICDNPADFETMSQGHGYMLYSRTFNQPEKGKLQIKGLRDYATVYINGERTGELNRITGNFEMEVDVPIGAVLEILVENLGRINFGAEILNNRKGIIGPVTINGEEVVGEWMMRSLPMDKVPSESDGWTFTEKRHVPGRPVVYRAQFALKKKGDTFLDMSEAGKGIVFINGRNLGRYWNIGPQQTLYVPGVWLKKGKNEIVIFEQLSDKPVNKVKTMTKPVLNDLKINTL